MSQKRSLFRSGLHIGRLTVVPAILWAILAASIAVGGAESTPRVANPVHEGLSRIGEIVLSDPHDFSFAVFGDNRGSTTVFERLLVEISNDPDILFAVSTGDIVGIGTPERFDFFFSQVAKYLSKPLVFAVGNHELLGGGADIYDSVVGRRNYSFTFGDTYFIIMDDTGKSSIDSGCEEWLRKELTVADGYGRTFVFMHVPLYDPPGTDIRHSLSSATAERLLNIFKDHRITHIFCSHIHGYYRADWDGIPYTISGGAGAPLVGTDPAHYFFHYLKVRVRNGEMTVEPVPVATDGT